MKTIKQIFAIAVIGFVLLLMGVTGAYLLIDDATLIGFAAKQFKSATGMQISYGKDSSITRTLSPVFQIKNFNIVNIDAPFKLSSRLFQFEISLPELLTGRLKISELVLEEARVETQEGSGEGKISLPANGFCFQISSKGLIDFRMSPPVIEAVIQAEVPDLERISFGLEKFTGLGRVSGKARITGTLHQLSLENVSAVWKKPQHTDVHLTGRVENLLELAGFDLSLNGRLEKPDFLSPTLPESFDPLEHISFSTQISGTYPSLAIQECRLNVKTVNALDLNMTGHFDLADNKSGLTAENMDFKLKFAAPNTRSARALFFDTVPEFGSVEGQAEIHSDTGAPSIEKIFVQTRDAKGIHVDLKGRINSFPLEPDISNTGYDLDVIMVSDKPSVMAERLGVELFAALDIDGPLNIKYRIEGGTQALRLEKIDLSAGQKNGIRVNTNGRISFGRWEQDDPIEFIDLVLQLESQSTKVLGKSFGKQLPELGTVNVMARFHTVSGQYKFDTKMTIGKAKINAAGSIVSKKGKPFISGKITAHNLSVPKLIEKKEKPFEYSQSETHPFFSREALPVDWLRKVELDLLFDIASFNKNEMNMESARFGVELDAGNLSIQSGRFVYPEGEISIDLALGIEKDLKFNFKASGENINPWQTLSMQQSDVKKDFDGDLDIDIDISSSGGSEHELAANMGGSIYIVVKNGKIRKEPLHLLFADFIGWTLDKTIGTQYVDINCGVAHYSITRGVIQTNGFIIDTKDITVVGEGTIDLAQEQVDYVFLPKKKSSLIGNVDPVKIRGPMNNPKIKAIPWKSAATTYGGLFFGPYVFAGKLALDFLSDTLRRVETVSPCEKYENNTHQR